VRLLADENFPGDTVRELRAAGHDVVWVRTAAPGASDSEVVRLANSEARLILTFDKDFGELAFRLQQHSDEGTILFRIPLRSPGFATAVVVSTLNSRSDWKGTFSVVDERKLRQRRLPARGERSKDSP
jgi:hypothetical protein